MIHSVRHRELVAGIAVTALLALIAMYLPLLGLVASVFLPLPVLFYRSKLGRPRAAIILIAVTLIVGGVMGWKSLTSSIFFFELGLAGILLSEAFEMNLPVGKTVAATTGVILAAGAVMLAMYGMFSQTNLWDLMSDYVRRNMELALNAYREMDVSQDQVDLLAKSMEGIVYVMLRILPAMVVVSALFVVWSNLLLARPLLRSRNLFYPDFGTLNKWRAPEALVWVVVVSGVLLLFPHNGLKMLGINGLIIMMMVYFFQGIAIVSFFFERKRFPRMLRVILYGLIALQQFVLLLVIVAGFFDVWIDFRRRLANRSVEKT